MSDAATNLAAEIAAVAAMPCVGDVLVFRWPPDAIDIGRARIASEAVRALLTGQAAISRALDLLEGPDPTEPEVLAALEQGLALQNAAYAAQDALRRLAGV